MLGRHGVPFGVRHQAKHTAVFGQHARNVACGAVRIVDIAERHTPLAFQPVERRGFGEVVAVMVRNREDDFALILVASRECRRVGGDRQRLRPACLAA